MSVADISAALQNNNDEALEALLKADNGNDYYAILKQYTFEESNAGFVQKLIQSPAAKSLSPYKKIIEAIFREAVHDSGGEVKKDVAQALFEAVKNDKFELNNHLSYLFNEAVSFVGQEDAVRDRLNKNAMIAKMIVSEGVGIDNIVAGYEASLKKQKQEIERKQQALESIKNSFK
jgi:hypothetical protein